MVRRYKLDYLNDDDVKTVSVMGEDKHLKISVRWQDRLAFDLEIERCLRNMMLHAAKFTEKAHYDKENAVKSLDMVRFCAAALLEMYEEGYNIKVAEPYTE